MPNLLPKHPATTRRYKALAYAGVCFRSKGICKLSVRMQCSSVDASRCIMVKQRQGSRHQKRTVKTKPSNELVKAGRDLGQNRVSAWPPLLLVYEMLFFQARCHSTEDTVSIKSVAWMLLLESLGLLQIILGIQRRPAASLTGTQGVSERRCVTVPSADLLYVGLQRRRQNQVRLLEPKACVTRTSESTAAACRGPSDAHSCKKNNKKNAETVICRCFFSPPFFLLFWLEPNSAGSTVNAASRCPMCFPFLPGKTTVMRASGQAGERTQRTSV